MTPANADGLDPATAQFSAARSERVVETGILTTEDRGEQLADYLVLKFPHDPPHDGTVQRMLRRLLRVLPGGWDLRVHSALVLSDSRPEPDFAIVREDPADYTTRHPRAGDVGSVIEVGNESLLRDQRDKTRLYSNSGIPMCWIVNLVDRWVEVYEHPSGPTEVPGYGSLQIYQAGDAVPLMLDGIVVASLRVDELLP